MNPELKVAAILFMFHWIGMFLLEGIELHPHPPVKLRQRRDAIRGLMTLVRGIIFMVATIGIVRL